MCVILLWIRDRMAMTRRRHLSWELSVKMLWWKFILTSKCRPLPFLTPSPPFPCTTYLCYYIVHWKLFQWFLPVSATLLRHYPIFAELSTGSMINKLRCSQPSYRNILISPRRTEWLQTWLWNYANRTWRVSLCGQELWKLRLWRTWFSAKRIKEERYSLIINAMFKRG